MKINLQNYIAGIGLEEFEHLKTDEAEQVVSDKLIDAGEITEVQHVDTAGDIEGTVEEIKNLEEVEASLEAYIDILNSAQGGIGRDAAAMLSVGLQRVSKVLGPVEIPSVECFGGVMSKSQATTVSLESLGEHLKAAGGKIKELIESLIQLVMKFVGEMMHDVDTLIQKASALRDKAKGLKGQSTTVQLKNAAALSIGGEFKGHDVSSIVPLVQFMGQKWVPGARRLIEVAAKGGDDVNKLISSTSHQCGFDAIDGKQFPGGLKFLDNKMNRNSLDIVLPQPKFESVDSAPVEVEVNPQDLFQRAQLILKVLGDYNNVCADYKALNSSLNKLKSSTALDRTKDSVRSATRSAVDVGAFVVGAKENPMEYKDNSPVWAVKYVIGNAGGDFTKVSKHAYKTLAAMVGVLAYEIQAVQAG